MGRFNLALDSAYVVQAMRLSPQNADRVKLKLYLSVAVIVLHLLALFALMSAGAGAFGRRRARNSGGARIRINGA